MNAQQVAETIRNQIGGFALKMLGAKNLSYGGEFGKEQRPYLGFRIGRNAKSVNYVKITINTNDLYDMEFGYIRGVNYTVRETVENVYCDQLNSMIEENTGMYTSL